MDNVDVCVCCGRAIPEGTMVCAECQSKHNTYKKQDIVGFVEEMCGMKLYWYQKLLLKLYEKSFRKTRRGIK